jgi:iron complex outermembrane receptor protein
MKAKHLFNTGVSVFVLIWAGHAAAQEASPASADKTASADSTVVVVTANRRSQTLQNAPVSVNVQTGEQLQKMNILQVKDLSRVVPGLELTNSTGRNDTVTLRGIGFDPDSGTAPTVQIYQNEVPVDAQTAFGATYDIGQIEVLRGPQGLNRGLSSPGGAITITTRRPNFNRVDGYVQGSATDHDASNLQFGVSYPITDKFAVRIAGVSDHNNLNQVRNVTNGEHSESSTSGARVTLGWRPTDNFTAYLTYHYLFNQNRMYQQVFGPGNTPSAAFGDTARSGPPIALDDYEGTAEGKNRFKNITSIIDLNLNWDLGGANLAFVGGHQTSDVHVLIDADTANAVPGWQSPQTLSSSGNTTTAELRLSSKDNDVYGWGVGAFYSKADGTVVAGGRSDSFFGPYPIAYGAYLPISTLTTVPLDSETLSFNVNGSVKHDKFTLEGGLRYTILKSTRITNIVASSPGYAPYFIAPFTQTISGVPERLRDQNDQPITGGLTLTWQRDPNMTLYASYGRSFRSGSVGIAAPAGIADDLIVSKPETTDSIEAGIKGSVFDRKLRYSFAAFDQKIDGFLTRLPIIGYNCQDVFGQCNPAGAPINNATDVVNGTFDFNYNGNATVKGIEVSINARPTDRWDVDVSASYVKARYDKDTMLPCNDYNGDGKPDTDGTPRITGSGNVSFCHYDRLAAAPDFSLTGSTEYRFADVGTAEPFVRGLLTYHPSVFQERSNYKLPTTTLIDLFAGLRLDGGRWEVTAFVKNILDERKITNRTFGGTYRWGTATTPYDSGYQVGNTTLPREFGIASSYRF